MTKTATLNGRTIYATVTQDGLFVGPEGRKERLCYRNPQGLLIVNQQARGAVDLFGGGAWHGTDREALEVFAARMRAEGATVDDLGRPASRPQGPQAD